MWFAHFSLFRGEGLTAWIRPIVVLLFSSLFNSHLFDFHEGWIYVLGVGVAGGMVLRARSGDGNLQEPVGYDRWHARLR
jgi:hypothetical protein